MIRGFKTNRSHSRFIQGRLLSSIVFLFLFLSLQARDKVITVHLRGVYESKISILPLSGASARKPLFVSEGIKNGSTATLKIPGEYLPGEFVLRFDYKSGFSGASYPSEKRIIINKQDLELWVNPPYSNNPDSTWFQADEKENTAYTKFQQEDATRRSMLGLLQEFLINYDNTGSKFYRDGIKEYEKRRLEYNKWIDDRIRLNKGLFVSTLYRFQYIPELEWQGSDSDRKTSLRENYFEKMDFGDTLIIKTAALKEWMDQYVNLYGELATSIVLRDSVFTVAGRKAIEKARRGDPLVYGWMVDYFFNGYESFNISEGIKMLEPYLSDPLCLTQKRQEINRRLEGMQSLVPGILAPDFTLFDAENNIFILRNYPVNKPYVLLVFWSADCSHCKELADKLYEWYLQPEMQDSLDIVTISVDETESEILAWQQKINDLKGWIHLKTTTGIRSQVAKDYFILSVPVMILLDSETQKIIAMPEQVEDIQKQLSGS